MPKDDSFYEDHTNRLWASWERASALNFYDSEEEAEHEQFLQERREQELREQWARWELEKERMRRSSDLFLGCDLFLGRECPVILGSSVPYSSWHLGQVPRVK